MALFVHLLIVLSFSFLVSGYRPVILMHGIFSGPVTMDTLSDCIQEKHSGTKVLNVDAYNDLDSIVDMWTQVEGVKSKIESFINSNEKVNFICYSQGGLVCRGILEKYQYTGKIGTVISLSSPQAGQYGSTEFMKYLFPNLTTELAYLLFYNKDGQKVSIANYWNDPYHQDLYEKECIFLPKINGKNATYKANFKNVERLVLIGGPDDGVITPWESSQFGFYKTGDKSVIVPMKSQDFYVNDWFGLKSLDEAGKIHTCTMSGINHLDWPENTDVFDKCILPWLD